MCTLLDGKIREVHTHTKWSTIFLNICNFRQTNGKQITLFFDMEKCGLSNMDLDFTKYLIGLFKDYYPYFLNYVIVFEMPWILSGK